jgi:CHASE2 domain-containing sensor protein
MNAKFYRLLQNSYGFWLTAFIITFLVSLLRLTGSLQILEWSALDWLFVRNFQKTLTPKIVIVNISEKDIQKLKQYPLNDTTLTQLLKKIKLQQPRVIGLGIFRDISVPSGSKNRQENQQAYQELLELFRTTPNLFGIEKVTQDYIYSQIQPSPLLKELKQTTAADIIVDNDGIVRRGILFPVTDSSEASAIPSLGLAVALDYLENEGIKPTKDSDGWLKLKDKVFLPFQSNDGSYIHSDDNGYQILINWRRDRNYFPQVSVSDVLNNQVDPDLFRDRIVLIGTTAVSVNNIFYTPHSHQYGTTPLGMYGIEIHAHLANYIIDTTLGNQPLLIVLSDLGEYIWLTISIGIIAFWGWSQRKYKNPLRLLAIIFSGTFVWSILIVGIAYVAFFQGLWIPIIPSLIGVFAAALTINVCIYIDKLQQANLNLEMQVADRTQKLAAKNNQLKSIIKKLKKTQSQLIAKEKLATLGRISAGIAHEIRNPLNLINLNAQLLSQHHQNLSAKIEESKSFFEDVIEEIFPNGNEIDFLGEKITVIQEQVQRGEKIIQDILFYTPSHSQEFTLVDLKKFIEETIALVENKKNIDAANSSTLVEFRTEVENLQVELIVNNFRRALINILENAYDSLKDKKNNDREFIPCIYIELKNGNSLVEIIIQDNGKGIDAKHIDKIFLPFYTQKQSGKGTGLGLFLTREIIVGEHQGQINLETELNEYCKFTISLPKRKQIFDDDS